MAYGPDTDCCAVSIHVETPGSDLPAVLCLPYPPAFQSTKPVWGGPGPPHLRNTVSFPVCEERLGGRSRERAGPTGGPRAVTPAFIQQTFPGYRSRRSWPLCAWAAHTLAFSWGARAFSAELPRLGLERWGYLFPGSRHSV